MAMSRNDSSVSRRWFVSGVAAAGAGALLARAAHAQPAPAAPPGGVPPGAAPPPTGKVKPEAARPSAPAELSPAAVTPSVVLPPLPYAEKALEPYISGTTVGFHYGKHHKGYVEKTNTLAQGTPLAGKELEEIVKRSAKGGEKQKKLFNAAAQTWNHNFYWQSMKPKGGGAPTGTLKERIDKDFGSYESFREQFTQTAVDHFSNGWIWLVLDKNKLKIVDTHDADTPLIRGQKPLLGSDVWEHSYYLDYKNARKDYVTAFLDHLLNWDFAAHNLG
jgi:superoxide dismutase, Fe-Mn family